MTKSLKNVDMTKGSIMKHVILFALPICVGNVLQQLYSTVDTLVIGNYCAPVSLAAVGTSSQPVEIMLCLFLGLGTGVSILVSQCMGKGDHERLKEVVSTATAFLYFCAIPCSILGILLGPAILKAMQVPADTMDHAVSYLQIIFMGMLGNMGYNMNAGILRGMGDSRSSVLFLLLSCAVNIVLDLFFIAVLGMDVAGAALATIIAMFSSWILSIVYIKKQYPGLELPMISLHINKKILRDIVAVGLPLGLNNSIYTVGHILMQSLVNLQGSAFMAACSVATKVTGIANIAITSFSSAATTFSGQNLGAENYSRLREGARKIPFFSGLLTAAAGIVVTLCCRPLVELFTKDPEVIEIAVRYIWIVLPFTWTYAVFNAIICFVNGIGEVRFPTVVNMLMLWVVRIPTAYFINYAISGSYIMACFPISFTFGMLAMLTYFFTKRWKRIRKLAVDVLYCSQEQQEKGEQYVQNGHCGR